MKKAQSACWLLLKFDRRETWNHEQWEMFLDTEVLFKKESLIVERGNTLVDIEAVLDIKVYMF